MALYFNMGIQCGLQMTAASEVAAHFKGHVIRMHDGLHVSCSAVASYDHEGTWVTVRPEGVNFGSPYGSRRELMDRAHLSEIGNALYGRLRSAPPFRFALMGWDMDFPLDLQMWQEQEWVTFQGLVLADTLWARQDLASSMEEFRPGYHWCPYAGEDLAKASRAKELIASDPVIEAYKAGVDRTLIRENLRCTPEERLRALQQLQLWAEELRRAGQQIRLKSND